jgi:putative membrane protein
MHRHLLQRISVALLSLTAAGGLGCSSDTNSSSLSGSGGSAGASGAGSAGTAGTATSGGSGMDAGAVALNDAQVATLLHLANQAEIRQAQMAGERAVDTDVRDFAQRMIEDHTAADTALTYLFSNGSVSPQADASTLLDAALSDDGGIPLVESGISQMLSSEASLHDQLLQRKTGEAFDLAYMTAQVAMHGELLRIIDNSLLPSAQNAALREQLQSTRNTVSMHSEHALEILNDLVAD